MAATIDDRLAALERANAELRRQLDACHAELAEMREQQTATAEVLQVINSSPGDLTPVFDAMLEKALRLCEAAFGMLLTSNGERFQLVAQRGLPVRFAEHLAATPAQPGPGGGQMRVLRGERFVHFVDMKEEEVYRSGTNPAHRAMVDLGGARTGLVIPLRKDDAVVGTFTVYRQEVRPFSDKQIALLQNFAAQAVIAMENARLLTETREALEQQTATAEVLQVINSSPGDLAPVFDGILDKAQRVCGVDHAALELYDGEHMHAVAVHGASDKFAETLRQGYRASNSPAARALLEGQRFAQIADATQIDHIAFRTAAEADGVHTVLFVPLRRDDAFLGMIGSARREVRLFSEKEIALLENFAAQAVIAMENARLLTETREALEQQTATAEVLQVINSSPGDLAPVFDAMLEKATRLCDAAFGTLWGVEGDRVRPVASHNVPEAYRDFLGQERSSPGPESAVARTIRERSLTHFIDAAAGEPYRSGDPFAVAGVDLGGVRTLLNAPLVKDDAVLGIIGIYRQEVRPFSGKQIALLQNFAAQAVIAMENARLITETREALEQQTATAEILQVINRSPGDLAPVFDAMLDKALTLCAAAFGVLWTYDGERVHAAALRGVPPAFAEFLTRAPHPVGRENAHGRLLAGEPVVHIPDVAEDEAYRSGDPTRRTLVEVGGGRTLLAVALRKDDVFLGDFVIYRKEVRPYSDKQIALLQNFAAQAVVAMENARLLDELRQRTDDLQESLEYQTAISDVLKVISQSTFDLEPVLQTVLDTAIRLCGNTQGLIFRREEDGVYRLAVRSEVEPEYLGLEARQAIRPGPDTLVGRTVLACRPVQIVDAMADADYPLKEEARVGQLRTMLGVPLLREGIPIGVICTARTYVGPFSEKQIALVTTFADQAVIAMENARLITELRERTDDLQESLEYQTAISDVLKVISQSGGELGPVLDTLVQTAARICEADKGVIMRPRDGVYHMAATFGWTAEFHEFLARNPTTPGRGTLTGRTALERRVVHVEDAANDPEYTWQEARQVDDVRTGLGVPLFREDSVIGVFALWRSRVELFTGKQIALVSTFADQAVIAIENARLFNELRERTTELGRSVEELKMLGEVGQAVSSTLDLRAVLSAILTASLGVTWANAGAVFRYSRAERAFRLVEAVGLEEAIAGSVRDLSIAEAETAMREATVRREPIQLSELAERPSAPLRDVTLAAGFHSALIVPLVGAERVFGAITLMRREAGEFPPETVRLMQTLASQSVLAIQNARLFREIAEKSEQLALASQHKSQFLANMSHELRTPLNAILGYGELLIDGIYGALPEKAQGVLERVQNNGQHLLALINDVLDLAKIEAGQLTLALDDYNLPELVRGVVTATEPLAAAKGLRLTAMLQDGMPMAHGDARRVSQVLLNLVGNAIKFTDHGEVEISATAEGRQFVLTVRDTGPGIADADQERIFGEFQQIDNTNTRKQGGTGLGLAISKRMIEMQGGMISVESVLGLGSTFRVVLPVQVEAMMEAAE